MLEENSNNELNSYNGENQKIIDDEKKNKDEDEFCSNCVLI